MKRVKPAFVHLHVHSHYSFLHGVGAPAEYARLAASAGMPAVALTDHLGLWGAVEFYRAARAAGVKPILGCEVHVPGLAPTRRGGGAPRGLGGRSHDLLLLALNRTGYENLVRLVSRSFLRAAGGGQPLVPAEDLEGRSSGLIAIAPALAGEVGRLILEGDEDAAAAAAAAWRERFGARFLLEVSDHGLAEERQVNRGLAHLSRRLGLPLVVGHDVHHPRPGDAPLWALVRTLARRGGCARSTRRPPPYVAPCRAPLTAEHWLKPPEAMAAAFAELPEALAATVALADRCDLELPLGELHLPPAPLPPEEEAGRVLRRLAEEGLRARLADRAGTGPSPAAYAARLERELDVIVRRGLASYFLVFWDLCRFARARGIPVGPGRGSAAGSLVAYCLGITEVDPVRHGLLFERFLNPERARLPDIDLDVCALGRGELVDYLFRRYGPGRVCRVGALARFGARGAVRAAGEALGCDPRLSDRLARLLPERAGAGLGQALTAWPELRALPLQQEPLRTLVAAAMHLEGLPRHPARHPAGVVVGGPELERLIPVYAAPGGEPVSQYALEDVEALGFLKFDVLGLRTLTVVAAAQAATRVGPSTPAPGDAAADAAAWELVARGETVGCFQMESPGIRRLLCAFQPRSVDDLAAALSLYRPGPWDPAAVAGFLRRRRGEEAAPAPHPLLAGILAETHGLLLYQEQVMLAAVAVAGFSLGEADSLRLALAGAETRPGQGRPALSACRARFLAGAEARGVDRREAEALFDLLERFAGYSFCKAHSTAYALLSYWTAHLKARWPAHYFAALLTLGPAYYAPWVYVAEARRAGAPVLPPDINRCTAGFEVEPLLPGPPPLAVGGASPPLEGPPRDQVGAPAAPGRERGVPAWGIRPGLLAVRGVGPALAHVIVEERLRGGPYRSADELRRRLEGAGRAGPRALAALPRALDALAAAGFLDALGGRADLAPERRIALEEEALGWSWSGRLLDRQRACLEAAGVASSAQVAGLAPGTPVAVAGRLCAAWRRRTRAGAATLTLLLHDGEGMVEVALPAEGYLRLFPRVAPGVLVVRGRVAAPGALEAAEASGCPRTPVPRITAAELSPLPPGA